MKIAITFAGAILLLLVVVAALFRKTSKVLPLGGSDIAQVGIVLGFTIAVYQILEVIGRL